MDYDDPVGDVFQEKTRYRRDELSGRGLDFSNRPEPFKEYPQAQKIALPSSPPDRAGHLAKILASRRSVRRFSGQSVSAQELSFLCWAVSGVREVSGGYALRTAPSAGALYPLETYVICGNVKDVPPGVYHYSVLSHGLERVREGDFREQASAAALDQNMCLSAPLIFAWTAVVERSKWKYRQRAYRYIYLDAGHMAQNLALAAVSLGMGTCQIGAIYDSELEDLLEVDGDKEMSVYMSVAGFPR